MPINRFSAYAPAWRGAGMIRDLLTPEAQAYYLEII